jgi:hypothetical protein
VKGRHEMKKKVPVITLSREEMRAAEDEEPLENYPD